MTAKLEYEKNLLEILNFFHNGEEEKDGNPYNTSFDVKVVSGLFSGYAPGWECDYKEWKRFVTGLKKMLQFQNKEIGLKDLGYGNEIRFEEDGLGHIEISGKIYGNDRIQSLSFTFMADQTVLKEFVKELEEVGSCD